ncbi:hypothetical protein GCM10009733_054800 [Nonomuraea maheshkhaliensis]|uniref:Uncharacterized protein n=1 Tax=Nonomuraea maheshkhaliensis TaxID=419590 RepID=A0ABN2FK48_9ACTN
MRAYTVACCVALCAAFLPAVPAVADSEDSAVPVEPVPVGGDVLGKFCISVPVSTLAKTFAAFFGLAGTGGGTVIAAQSGVQPAAQVPAAVSAPVPAPVPAPVVAPVVAPAPVPVNASPAGTQSLAGVPLMERLVMGAGLPRDLTILEAVPC